MARAENHGARIDFEAEGLLNGTRGRARQGRLRLLQELEAQGVGLEELRQAVQEERLVLLPAERVLEGGGPRYTRAEVAERVGIDLGLLRFLRQALGLPMPEESEAGFTEADVEAARRVKSLVDAGLPVDELLEVTRVMSVAMSQVSAASRGLVGRAMVRRGDTELDVARRYMGAAQVLRPLMAPTLGYMYDLHLREQLRSDVFGREELTSGPAGSEQVTACFADFVGFTRLGEALDAEDLGALVGKLGELAAEVAFAPVRLVKMIGDAAMLVSPDTDALLDSALSLVAAADAEGEGFPQLRAGLAYGPAVPRAGDWYGQPINLASRVTAIARPGSVLASEEVRDAAGNRYRWSFAGSRRLKGVGRRVNLFRVRRRAEGDDAEQG
jgi:adenylate cyclase